jgi:dTDP-4-dehydrorhamnose reductase
MAVVQKSPFRKQVVNPITCIAVSVNPAPLQKTKYIRSMKIIITGATGMVGSEVVRQALSDNDITKVTALIRRPLATQHPKLNVIIHKDFLDYTSLTDIFKEADACIWCLGVSQLQVSKEEYIKITHDYAIAAAKAMMRANPSVRFLFVSGEGADNTEQSKTIFAREKGRTENDLKKSELKNLYIIRPGSIKPVNGYSNVPFAYRIGYTAIKILYPLVKIVSPSFIIKSTEIAKAVLHISKKGDDRQLIGNKEMIALSKNV